MDILFEEESEAFISMIMKYYSLDGVDIVDLIEQSKRLDLISSIGSEECYQELRNEIFDFYNTEYRNSLRYVRDKNIVNMGRDLNLKEGDIVRQSLLFGQIREGSGDAGFKSPYPTKEMICRKRG